MKVDFSQAIALLKSGEPLIFDTDTVVGIGVAVNYAQSPQKLFEAKGRDEGKPVAWLIGSVDDLARYGSHIQPYAYALAEELWPGELTLVVEASCNVPAPFCSQHGTIGLRIPKAEVIQRLIKQVGPLATTSANVSGHAAPASIDGVSPQLLDGISVLDCASKHASVASTVLDCTTPHVHVLRAGTITPSKIEDALAAHGKEDAWVKTT